MLTEAAQVELVKLAAQVASRRQGGDIRNWLQWLRDFRVAYEHLVASVAAPVAPGHLALAETDTRAEQAFRRG